MKAKAKTAKPNLPFGLVEADLKYPAGKDRIASDVGQYGQIKLYEVESDRHGGTHFWVVCTLHISNPGSRRGNVAARTYGMRADTKSVVRVGFGPHVKREVNVYVRQSRVKALAEMIELYTKGMADAGMIRDTISTNRARGALRRGSHFGWMT